MPTSCDTSGCPRGNRLVISSSASSPCRNRCRCRDPSWAHGFFHLPTPSTATAACRRGWPVQPEETKELIAIAFNITFAYHSQDPVPKPKHPSPKSIRRLNREIQIRFRVLDSLKTERALDEYYRFWYRPGTIPNTCVPNTHRNIYFRSPA